MSYQQTNVHPFISALLTHFKTHYPDQASVIGEDHVLLKWIESRIEQIRSFDIITPADIKKVVNVAMIFGESFDRLPWAKEILLRNASARARSLLLEARCLQQLQKLSFAALRASRKDDASIQREFSHKHFRKVKAFQEEYKLSFDTDRDITRWLKEVAAKGLSQGFSNSTELELFLDLSMRHGKNFIEDSWAQNILQQSINTCDKLMMLVERSNKIVAQELGREIQLSEDEEQSLGRLLLNIDESFLDVEKSIPAPPSPMLAGFEDTDKAS